MKASGCLWNTLTVFLVALTLTACVWMGAVFMNPQAAFNPLRPQPPGSSLDTPIPAQVGTPTEAINFPTLPPEWTATFTPQVATATRTVTPTRTPTDTREPTSTVLLTPVGPTPTESETLIPTRTPTVRPPAATQVPPGYPPTQELPTETLPTPYP